MVERAAALARVLHSKGFRAQVGGPTGHATRFITGRRPACDSSALNGQLLTPQAGSRRRITLIHTNTQLIHDEPVRYGIQAICDACKVCVRRCPLGAIPQSLPTTRASSRTGSADPHPAARDRYPS